jgi:hypothetical protein
MPLRYFDRQDHAVYGSKLIIYRRSEDPTKPFTFRAKIDGIPDYIRRSTGTADPAEAMLKAQTAYDDLLVVRC